MAYIGQAPTPLPLTASDIPDLPATKITSGTPEIDIYDALEDTNLFINIENCSSIIINLITTTKILLNGFDPNSAQKNIILPKVGMLFQGGALFDSLPIWQNVAFRYLHGKQKINASEARKIAIEKLERVGLKKSFADNFPSELSGGMQKRVALARAIATQPEIIFFDVVADDLKLKGLSV